MSDVFQPHNAIRTLLVGSSQFVVVKLNPPCSAVHAACRQEAVTACWSTCRGEETQQDAAFKCLTFRQRSAREPRLPFSHHAAVSDCQRFKSLHETSQHLYPTDPLPVSKGHNFDGSGLCEWEQQTNQLKRRILSMVSLIFTQNKDV